MENDISQKNKTQVENNYDNQNDIFNKYKSNEDSNRFNFEKNEKNNSEILSIFDKYKLQNAEGSNNDIKENKNANVENNMNNNNKNEDIEQEMIRKNNNYTEQINEIISKNFKKVDLSQNIDYNLNLNKNLSNDKYDKYLELDRERKLLLLKNIELEKEINNLNNFVDIETKFNQNKIKHNKHNKQNKKNIESYNNKIKYNKTNNKLEDKKYIKDIKQAKNMIKILDKRINKLKQDINMNYNITNNKHQEKIKEVKIWRETFYEEFFKYKNLLNDLKQNLTKDKVIYNNVISNMKQKASENINNIFENYKSQIIDNEKRLNFLKIENEKLTSKENKVKEIYLYNFK